MKKRFTFFYLLFPIFAFSQNVLGLGTTWYEYFEDTGIWSAVRHNYLKTIVISDTIIANHNYFVLQNIHLDSVINQMQGNVTSVSVSIDYSYWRDSMHRFYHYIPATGTDSLCYDFTKQVGDFMIPNNSNCQIGYIDTVYLGAIPLKRFKRDSLPNPFSDIFSTMIEGIGMLSGFERPFVCATLLEETRAICCYSNQYGTLNISQGYNWLPQMCGLSLGNENESEPISVLVFPNPSEGKCWVISEKTLIGGNIQLFDGLGNKVLEMPIQAKESLINTGNLSKGIYFLRINAFAKTLEYKLSVL